MTIYKKEQIIKRFKSLAWRLGAIIAVFVITAFQEEIMPLLGLSDSVKVVLGLVLGEVTKYLNS
jgi:hypothetical protein